MQSEQESFLEDFSFLSPSGEYLSGIKGDSPSKRGFRRRTLEEGDIDTWRINVYYFSVVLAKKLIVVMLGLGSVCADARDVRVRGYVTKRGRYVGSYHRTSPNKTKADNYSTKGQINPWNGKAGSKSLNGGGK